MDQHTALIDRNKMQAIIGSLVELGLTEVGVKSEYEEFRFKGENANVTYYKSGKLLIQGKGTQRVKEALFGKEESVDDTARIGSDEVGKGDYFGPMVVVAAYLKKDDTEKLKKLGVMDSKRLSDESIVRIAESISGLISYEYKIISPAEYDELVRKYKNVSIVLAKAHVEVIGKLMKKVQKYGLSVEKIVVDQFSKSRSRLLNEIDFDIDGSELIQMHHGESDPAVAAASILARWIFLDEWQKMEDKYNFKFPKGASNVIAQARVFLDGHGSEELDNVAKTSFKTTGKVMENELPI